MSQIIRYNNTWYVLSGHSLSLVYNLHKQKWRSKGKDYEYYCINLGKLIFPKDFPHDKVMIKIVSSKRKTDVGVEDMEYDDEAVNIDEDRLLLNIDKQTLNGGKNKMPMSKEEWDAWNVSPKKDYGKEITEFLKENKHKAYTLKEIAEAINCSISSFYNVRGGMKNLPHVKYKKLKKTPYYIYSNKE